MIIRNVTHADLDNALAAANRPTDVAPNYRPGYGGNGFGGNIRFKRIDRTSRPWMPGALGTYRVTLTVHSSRAPGARRSTDGSRRIAAACWHAHGAFMKALPPTAVVITSPMLIGQKPMHWSPGDALQDFSIGSYAYPCMASEACEC